MSCQGHIKVIIDPIKANRTLSHLELLIPQSWLELVETALESLPVDHLYPCAKHHGTFAIRTHPYRGGSNPIGISQTACIEVVEFNSGIKTQNAEVPAIPVHNF